MALRDEIKKFVSEAKPAVQLVPTPELPQWDGQIYVTRVSPLALANYYRGVEENEEADAQVRFVCLVAADSEGSRIFQEEDVLWLSTCGNLMPMIERLYAAGRWFNGLTEENRTAWRKNLNGTGAAGSPCSCAAPAQPDSASTSSAS